MKIGRLVVKYFRRSSKEFWGRFGGGWNWKIGVQVGGRTVLISLLVCEIMLILLKKGEPYEGVAAR